MHAPLDAVMGLHGAPPAEIAGGGPISSHTLDRLLCDCALSVVVTDHNGDPVYVTDQVGTVTPKVRRAVLARDRGCVFPGCDRPVDACEVHHINGRTGPARARDLATQCVPHHHYAHRHDIRLDRSSGTWRGYWPDGTQIRPPPAWDE